MKDKYYIPDITEFHIGFECCINQFQGNSNIGLDRWIPKTIRVIGDIPYEIWIKEDYRVKYLDRSDIEYFGFKVTDERARWQFSLGSYKLYTGMYTKEDDIPREGRITISDDRDDHNYFDGVIKNKSELRRILIQTGIVSPHFR